MDNLLTLNNISKVYQNGDTKTIALNQVNLKVKSGEFVAIMGPSGSGKSTLMHILGALDTPTSGTYFLNGQEVQKLSDDDLSQIRNRQIGFIFQAFNLLPRLTALQNVALPAMYAGVSQKKRLSDAKKYLIQVGLADRLSHKSNQLSGGQQQRVAIARALMLNPSIILADEPTGNIASAQADEIMNIFQDLNGLGHTIIMITHEPDISAYAKRIITIKDGQIISDRKNK